MRELIEQLIAAIEAPQKGSKRREALAKAREALDKIAPAKQETADNA